ncbi:MAG: DMT family transporter [Acidimicrobiales bacterium]|nr:DMT family transporter [Acidimicrobiales bacterium]MDG2217451.1 DMT family transporter [Acidimicrobiales bacterium]
MTVRAEDAHFETTDWALLLTLSAIWGSSFLLIALGLDAFEPGLVTLLRVGLGAITLAVVPGARGSIPRRDLGKCALVGLTWMAFPLTLFPIAQQWVDSSVAGMLNSAMPLMTVLIAWLAFGTPTGPRRLLGVGVGFVGILLISIPEASSASTNAIGVLLVIVAVGSYGIAANLAGPLQREHGSLPVAAWALGFAVPFCIPYGVVGIVGSSFAWSSFIACAAIGIGGTGIAYAIAVTLSGRVGAVRLSLVTYIIPAVSIALGVVFRDETISGWAIAGTIVVLVGAFLSSRVDGSATNTG